MGRAIRIKTMSKVPQKTILGLPNAVLRRVLVLTVIGFPFVGSSLSPLLRASKKAVDVERNCEHVGEPSLSKIASVSEKSDKTVGNHSSVKTTDKKSDQDCK